jgi:hypothetical protein
LEDGRGWERRGEEMGGKVRDYRKSLENENLIIVVVTKFELRKGLTGCNPVFCGRDNALLSSSSYHWPYDNAIHSLFSL